MSDLESSQDFIAAKTLLKRAMAYTEENGTHRMNPYHNLQHCNLVATVSVFYGQQDFLAENELETLALAGIFHDFNHSGKPLRIVSDSENIRNAISGFLRFSKKHRLSSRREKLVLDIIASTEVKVVDNSIQFQPNPLSLARYVRDADVTQLLFVQGQYLQKGLSKEMEVCFDGHFARKAFDFVNHVELFTVPALARRVSSQSPMQNWLEGFRVA